MLLRDNADDLLLVGGDFERLGSALTT